jgi:hypothetical protein
VVSWAGKRRETPGLKSSKRNDAWSKVIAVRKGVEINTENRTGQAPKTSGRNGDLKKRVKMKSSSFKLPELCLEVDDR